MRNRLGKTGVEDKKEERERWIERRKWSKQGVQWNEAGDTSNRQHNRWKDTNRKGRNKRWIVR